MLRHFWIQLNVIEYVIKNMPTRLMLLRTLHTLTICVVIAVCAVAQDRPRLSGQPDTRAAASASHHTRIELLSDTKAVLPGSRFTLGVLMKMDDGWHTYWKNPGEAGLPTRIRWSLPDGFVAEEIQWPFPKKNTENGEVITYGYVQENMLLVPVQAPKNLKPGTRVALKADVNWLECEHICVPGSGSAELLLPVAADAPSRDNQELFDKYRSLVPAPFSQQGDIAVETRAHGKAVEVLLKTKRAAALVVTKDVVPDFYPETIDDIVIGRTEVLQASDNEVTLRVPLSVQEKRERPATFRGVIVYRLTAGDRKGAEIEIPLTKEFCSTLPLAGTENPAVSLLDQTFVPVQGSGEQQPLFLFILFAIAGGLLLNIMPCVLPVIALKVFGLVKMVGDDPKKVKKVGWVFSGGILASFLALAVLVILLRSAGQEIGWGFQFQEPLFVIAMSAVVFAFGLSLFGVFEIRLPGAAVAGVSNALAKSGTGYAGTFVEGVFATILATPCTAPFLGAALGFAFAQTPAVILLIFAAVASGMALPYLLLTAKPAWMKFLPKPGDWMETAKQFMGFLMMATLVWLLYILGKQLGMEAVIWTIAFLLSVGVACWIIGRFATLTATRKKYVTSWGVALAITALGYWGFMESALDVRSVIAGTPAGTQPAAASDAKGIRWKQFSLEELENHLKENKTVFIDFTAEWCLTCKLNEKAVMSDEAVAEKFESAGVVAIRADWTNRNPEITRLLAKFGRSGVPLYVIFPAGKPSQPIVLPEVITKGIVIDAIDRASHAAAPRLL